MTLVPVNAGEIRERLKIQLVSTVGPYGTNRGCTLAQTKREFVKDWNESLEDYARSLGYNPTNDGVRKMIADLSDVVRLDSTNGETKVYAVNNQKLSHCFWLIDNTRKRERHSSRGSARKTSLTSRCERDHSESDTVCFNCWKTGHVSRECRERHVEPTCFDCGGSGHFSRECTRSRRGLCYNCYEPGHISRDCPKNQRQLLQIADRRTSAKDANAGWLECENCCEMGHISRECPKKQQHILKRERRSSRGSARKKSRTSKCGRHHSESSSVCFNCWKTGHVSRECRERHVEPMCFDRGGSGHFSRECTRSRSGLCNNCYEPGHISLDCPKYQRELLQISDATVSRNCNKEYSKAQWLDSNYEKNRNEDDKDGDYNILKNISTDFEKMCIIS